MIDLDATTQPGPYAAAALNYLQGAWQGVLPVTGKWPPPKGYTGADGLWPSSADVLAWADGAEGRHNIGLRLPPHLIGIDVDAYGGKPGLATFADALTRWGPLPTTWTATSRTDGSGIRLFTVPPGLKWPGVLGPGVEIIQYRHRYAMCWPSVHPDTGQTYRWLAEGGVMPDGVIPFADELPLLPPSWVIGLTHDEAERDVAKLDLSDEAVALWLAAAGNGEQCAAVLRALQRAIAELASGASRHDTAMRSTARLALLAAEGHKGVHDALTELGVAFAAAVKGDASRSSEWDRMIGGAVRIAAVRGVQPLDPCAMWGGGPVVAGPDIATPVPGVLTESPPPPPTAPPLVEPGRAETAGAVAAPRLSVVPDLVVGEPLSAPVPSGGPDLATDPMLALEVAQQRVRRQAKRLLDDEEAAAGFTMPPSVIDLGDELAIPDEDVAYRVAEVLPVGGNVLLAAQFKAGKTTLINNLAKALADGAPFLGQLLVQALAAGERVAIFNYEVSRPQYRRWLREAAIENTDAVAVLNVRGFRMPITSRHVEDQIVAWLIERNVRVWIVDPFARAFTGASENDNTEVGRWLDTLDVIKQRAGVGELVLPTHTGRALAEEGQERARGATRLDDWADVRWMLNKNDLGERFFSATGRDVEYAERQLSYKDSTRQLAIAGGDRAAARGERTKSAVMAVLHAKPGLGVRELRAAVRDLLPAGKDSGAGQLSIDNAIKALVASGHCRLDEQGAGKSTYHYPATPSPFGGPR